ncbi:hypothetical protein E2C01_082491 [Portunus trituberculatus]|uniref:Uncharacterized protein n=1 Tax=Portunus trituberculatus TaxID=210409 RepID=A0A5B7IQ31_PORTR|nr:hypothetical protein [Portunus trituberculatus]
MDERVWADEGRKRGWWDAMVSWCGISVAIRVSPSGTSVTSLGGDTPAAILHNHERRVAVPQANPEGRREARESREASGMAGVTQVGEVVGRCGWLAGRSRGAEIATFPSPLPHSLPVPAFVLVPRCETGAWAAAGHGAGVTGSNDNNNNKEEQQQ